jgi:hypothetical protein
MIPRISLRKALADPQLLGGTLVGDSWRPWRTLLIAAMGEALDDDERTLFKQFTGREREPGRPVEEAVFVKGRRAGGSRAISVLVSYVAGLCTHPALVPGERGICLVVAADQRQATVILEYTEAVFRASPILRQLIESRTQRTLRLSNQIDIEVRPADFRSVRGLSFVVAVADELAFWMTSETAANPDSEILAAIRPGLATTGGSCFQVSSPYARRGELWRAYQQHYGPHGDPAILVAQGSSRAFNATLPESLVSRAMERDPASASAEYLAQFRTDIESFVSIEAVNACVSRGVFERRRQPSISYSAAADPSGGSVDSFTLCIGHVDHSKQAVIIDLIREAVPPFSPEAVVEEFSKVIAAYGLNAVTGDRYGGLWPVEQFSKFGIRYDQAAAPKSDLYRDLLPLLNSGRIELLDHPKLIAQLCNLERRVARGGRDSIDSAPGGHDDLSNVCALLASINNKFGGFDSSFSFVDGTDADDPNGIETFRRARLAAYLNSHGLVRL